MTWSPYGDRCPIRWQCDPLRGIRCRRDSCSMTAGSSCVGRLDRRNRRHTFSAVLGAVTAAGRDNSETFTYFRPASIFILSASVVRTPGWREHRGARSLRGRASRAFRLREAGLWIGIAGNQTPRAAELLRKLNLPVDLIATSGEWGVAKRIRPSSAGSSRWLPAVQRRSLTWGITETTTSSRRGRPVSVPLPSVADPGDTSGERPRVDRGRRPADRLPFRVARAAQPGPMNGRNPSYETSAPSTVPRKYNGAELMCLSPNSVPPAGV